MSTRTGARTFITLMVKICRLSHTKGFALGMRTILGPDSANDFLALWEPACILFESLQALDDHFNQRDATLPDADGSEDAPFG
jgi:hypothetical protein